MYLGDLKLEELIAKKRELTEELGRIAAEMHILVKRRRDIFDQFDVLSGEIRRALARETREKIDKAKAKRKPTTRRIK